MKVGEFYRNRFNHYVSQVTEITDKYVILTNIQDVSDKVKLENFKTNWSLVTDIRQFETTIRNKFPDYFNIYYKNNDLIAEYDFKDLGYDDMLSKVVFSIINPGELNEALSVIVSEDLRVVLKWNSDNKIYKVADALDVICMIADQM